MRRTVMPVSGRDVAVEPVDGELPNVVGEGSGDVADAVEVEVADRQNHRASGRGDDCPSDRLSNCGRWHAPDPE